MGVGWEGDKVRLVPLDKGLHLENALRWMNDSALTRWLVGGDFPLTRLREEEFFDRMMKEDDRNAFFAVETRGGEHIGFSGLFRIEWRHRSATTATLIAPRENWRKGYGTDAAIVRTRYAFEVLGLRLLLTEVMDGNEGSRRALLKAGYVEYGRIPGRYWKRGEWRDSILLYRRAEDGPAERSETR